MTEEHLASIASALDRELRAVPSSPVELGARLAAFDLDLAGDPWARWLLLALHRHEARQSWVGEIVRERLKGDLQDIGRAGGFGHPDGDQGGNVPGMPEVGIDPLGFAVHEGRRHLTVRHQYLQSVVDGPRAEQARFALKALAALGREHAEVTVARQLQREPFDGVVSSALDLIAEWGISPHREAIAEAMRRARGVQAPAPHIRVRCAELLMCSAAPNSLGKHERKSLLKALKQPSGASDGEPGLLLYLLDERVGFRQLRNALASHMPIARTEAACAFGVIGSPEAIAILREVESPESQTIVALLGGHSPVNGPEPIGQPIEWEGQVKRVYRMDEVMAAEVGDLTAASFAWMQERYGALVRRWLAS